jgi:hypothetical protein
MWKPCRKLQIEAGEHEHRYVYNDEQKAGQAGFV